MIHVKSNPILPDLLSDGLLLVVCGTAVGKQSERDRAYYAGRGNQFWPVLTRVSLTPPLSPDRYRELLQHGIGLTDLAKRVAGNDKAITASEYDISGLRSRIITCAPKVLAFNGKTAAKRFFHCRAISYGWQTEQIGNTRIFVLPSTSGSARRYWDEAHWRELAAYIIERKATS